MYGKEGEGVERSTSKTSEESMKRRKQAYQTYKKSILIVIDWLDREVSTPRNQLMHRRHRLYHCLGRPRGHLCTNNCHTDTSGISMEIVCEKVGGHTTTSDASRYYWRAWYGDGRP